MASSHTHQDTTGRPARTVQVSNKTLATIDHDTIRRWAEARGARPATVRPAHGTDDAGIIRIDFPGRAGEASLGLISWDDWFERFDASGLALVYQDTTAEGQQSNFNKLVRRDTLAERLADGDRASVH